MWAHVCLMGVVCFRVWHVPGHMRMCDLCGLYGVASGPGVLCTHQCKIASMGTPSFLLCQVSVAGPSVPSCMGNNRPQTLDRARYPGCREGKLKHSKRGQSSPV